MREGGSSGGTWAGLFLWRGSRQEFFEGYRDVAIALLFASAAHWEAVGGRREVTDCNQNSVGFLHNVCVFCFCVAAQTD